MAEPKFNILSKPPPEGDSKGWYRWFYRVCEILNKIPVWVYTLTAWPFSFTTPAQGDLITYDIASGLWISSRKIGTTSSYTSFEADGTMVAAGGATVWNDIFVDGLSTTGGATDPPTFDAFLGTVFGRRFDNGATMSTHGSFEIQHDYKEGTDLELHIHWSPTTTNVGNVVWGVEYTIAGRTAVFPAVTTVTIALPAGGVVAKHNSNNVAIIPGLGVSIGAVIPFRIFRLGATALDTFTGDCFLHRIGIHYVCDTLGSRQVSTK